MNTEKRYRCLVGHVVKPAKNGHVPPFCPRCNKSVRPTTHAAWLGSAEGKRARKTA